MLNETIQKMKELCCSLSYNEEEQDYNKAHEILAELQQIQKKIEETAGE